MAPYRLPRGLLGLPVRAFSGDVAAQRKERAAVVDEVVDAVQRFKPEGLEPLFPPPAPMASAE